MKKCILGLLIFLTILYSFAFTVFAAESVSFSMSDEQVAPNRLVTVEMKAESSNLLSAATFEFEYDSSMLEYRSVKASDKASKIVANDKGGKLKVVYLNTDGKDISDECAILSITFKAVREGTSYIDFSVSDCVDGNVQFLDIGKCKAAEIKVTKNTADTVSKDDKSDDKRKNGSSGGKSKRETTADDVATIDELGSLNSFNDKNLKFLYIGIGGGIGFVVLVLLAYFIGRRSLENKIKRETGKYKNGDKD